MFLYLEGLPAPIRLCERSLPVADALASVLKDWPSRLDKSHDDRPVFMEIERANDGFDIHRVDDGWRSRETDDLGVVSSTIIEIIDGYVANGTGLGLLHAGSAEFAGRLLLFPASTLAGKSTLMTRLSAAGHKVFSDDLIPLDLATGEAVATGCLPRPRLPLPPAATPEFSAFVESHVLARDEYCAYIDPGVGRRAGFGDRRAIGAVVLLRRSTTQVEARIEPAPAEDVLWALVSQDTRKDSVAADMLDDYLRLLSGLRFCQLHYSDLEDAVRCLEAEFAGWPSEDRDGAAVLERDAAPIAVGATYTDESGPRFQRAEHVDFRAVGQGGFVVDRRTNRIHHLNPTGLAIWRLLEGAATQDSVVSVFAEAFPDTPAETIAHDVDTSIGLLLQLELIAVSSGEGGSER